MKRLAALLLFAALATTARTQAPDPVLGDQPVKISDHVWALMGWPNIAIIVGARATLVVDTGLGPRNGATIVRVATKLAPANRLYLTTTHFHPEHASGDAAFPAGTILIRDLAQQQEMEKHGLEMISLFSGRNDTNKNLLADVHLRSPDILFSNEASLDLGGGVSAHLFWLGQAHTKGDELTFVTPDRTLVSGDVVQNKTMPNIYGDGGTPSTWLAVLDKVAAMNPLHILPDHSAPGDGSLIAAESDLIATIRTHALALKAKGVTAEEAGTQVTATLKTQHPDWPNTNATAFVKSVYAEQQ